MTSTSIPPTTNTRKASEPADVNDASNQSANRKVRGGSTSDDTQTSVECTTDQSPTTPDRRGATGGAELDSEPPKDVENRYVINTAESIVFLIFFTENFHK